MKHRRNFSSNAGLRATVRNLTLALGALILLAAPQGAAAAIPVYPAPGTLTAGSGTQISFRDVAPAALGTVTVTASKSGKHPGTLQAHSDGKGASFIPAKPFKPGDKVTVSSAASGTFSFTVGDSTTRGPRTVELPGVGHGATQRFASRPDLGPPSVTVTTAKPGRAPGYVFIAPKAGRGQDGPMILDDAGKMVWFKPVKGAVAADFRVQSYLGQPVLTWWQGRLFVGDGTGEGEIYDTHYQPVATVHAGNGFPFDLHEFTITPRGTALITVYQRFKKNFAPWHGTRDGRAVDSIVQEIDIKTGLVLFEWHSLGNVGLSESEVPPPTHKGFEWDYMHVNAVDEDSDGNLLISGRNTSAIYKVSRATGKVMWRLGGRKSDFKLGPGVRFAWQHNVRRQADGTITLYDNEAAPPVRKLSRVLQLRLDEAAKTASVVSAWSHTAPPLLSASQGDVQVLPNGDRFVGFGSQRYFSEFSATGQLLFDGRIAAGNDTYRAFRFPWTGAPAEPPRISATAGGGGVLVKASWNGATAVARWEVLAGASQAAMTPVGSAVRSGFETSIAVKTGAPLVAVRALDATGNALGSSAAIKPAT